MKQIITNIIIIIICVINFSNCIQLNHHNNYAPLPANGKDVAIFQSEQNQNPLTKSKEVKEYLENFWKEQSEKEQQVKSTAWDDRPNPNVKPAEGQSYTSVDADFGADEGATKDPTKEPAKDFEDKAAVDRAKKEALEASYRKLEDKLRQSQDTIKKMQSTDFANTLVHEVNTLRDKREADEKAEQERKQAEAAKAKVTKKTAQQKKDAALKHAYSAADARTKLLLAATGKIPSSLKKKLGKRKKRRKHRKRRKHKKRRKKGRKKKSFIELKSILTPMQLEDSSMDLKERERPGANPTNDNIERKETILGDILTTVPSSYKLLPLVIETDGAKSYPISAHNLGPELLTKVGLRLAIKGKPIRTDAGEEALEVTGWKVVGTALAKKQ